jgi:hypothetical protein
MIKPFPQANDPVDGPAGCVCPARIAGWIAWWPGTNRKACAALTLRAYDFGIQPPHPEAVPIMLDGSWVWQLQENTT